MKIRRRCILQFSPLCWHFVVFLVVILFHILLLMEALSSLYFLLNNPYSFSISGQFHNRKYWAFRAQNAPPLVGDRTRLWCTMYKPHKGRVVKKFLPPADSKGDALKKQSEKDFWLWNGCDSTIGSLTSTAWKAKCFGS